MFLRRTERKKNGKTHSYWNVVENKRLDDGRVVQRHVVYLGEINSSQAAAWRKAIEVFDEDVGRSRTLALFPEGRCEAAAGDASVVQLRLLELRRAEEALAQRTRPKAHEPVGVPHDLRAKVIALGNRLPALWENSTTRRDHRKALLRCLIEKVVMRRCARDKAEVR